MTIPSICNMQQQCDNTSLDIFISEWPEKSLPSDKKRLLKYLGKFSKKEDFFIFFNFLFCITLHFAMVRNKEQKLIVVSDHESQFFQWWTLFSFHRLNWRGSLLSFLREMLLSVWTEGGRCFWRSLWLCPPNFFPHSSIQTTKTIGTFHYLKIPPLKSLCFELLSNL